MEGRVGGVEVGRSPPRSCVDLDTDWQEERMRGWVGVPLLYAIFPTFIQLLGLGYLWCWLGVVTWSRGILVAHNVEKYEDMGVYAYHAALYAEIRCMIGLLL